MIGNLQAVRVQFLCASQEILECASNRKSLNDSIHTVQYFVSMPAYLLSMAMNRRPMVGIRIDHHIPGVISEPPYTILELARAGLMDVHDWQYVEANVEQYEDPDGTKKIRLKD